MGGDFGPEPIVAGVRMAVEQHGIQAVLVGDPGRLTDIGDLDVIEALDVIGMDDRGARSVRSRNDASVVVAARSVREGAADAMFSAGHTGATLASALLRIGRVKGVARPAVVTPLRPPGKTQTLLLDAGANVECQASWMVQFAIMGAVCAQARFGVQRPKVGLVSIGEEEGKGTPLVVESQEAFAQVDWSALNIDYVGNAEGRDVVDGVLDVAVTDGFTGNVLLKGLEALSQVTLEHLAAALDLDPGSPGARLLADLTAQTHPDTQGGALLLGVKAPCLVGHGRSGPKAVANALVTATEALECDLAGRIQEALGG